MHADKLETGAEPVVRHATRNHRRAFVLQAVGGALLGWPRHGRAQTAPLPIIGFLNSGSPGAFAHLLAGFRQGLGEVGLVEGRDVTIDYRWAEGRYGHLSDLARDLLRRPLAVLVATGGENAALAAKAATTSVPIVFAIGGDPVQLGLVSSLGRPEGNLTGLTQYTGPLEGKRLGLLRELVPSVTSISVLVNPTFANAAVQLKDLEEGARMLGVRLVPLSASSDSEIETAFTALVRQRTQALVVGSDPFFNTRRDRLTTLAARHKIPAVYEFREFTAAGGLMSYGANLADGYRQIGAYTARIVKGARPGELPVLQPTRFEFVINLKVAKALGITIPQPLLLRADEVIQ
jgi:putative ABC transport system substrate-binding protein